MIANYRRVPTRFSPETRFELAPQTRAAARADVGAELERLKDSLLEAYLAGAANRAVVSAIKTAGNEAAALAWLTPYPLLVLPALLEEKAEAALRQTARQEQVRRRSLTLGVEAA